MNNPHPIGAPIVLCQTSTDFGDSLNQDRDIVEGRELRNAVAQVEHVAYARSPLAKTLYNPCNLHLNMLWAAQQNRRIQVTLQRNTVSDSGAGLDCKPASLQHCSRLRP